MHHTGPDPQETVEESLRRENQQLRERLERLQGAPAAQPHPQSFWHPSGVTIAAMALAVTVLIIIAFFAGYIPLQSRRSVIAAEAQQVQQSAPKVNVIRVERSTRASGIILPGNIQPVTEAPILARADGYVLRRLADIGDRVKAGQTLAEIDAPELTDQVSQARASEQQAEAALEQATANVQQGKTDMELARVTAQRSANLVARGAVARQDDDQYQAQYQAKLSVLQSLEKAVEVQRANINAARSNLARLEKLQDYRVVVAPFDGIITQRNVDTGALVNAGNTMLFRIAQIATLRTYVNVPQSYANSIRPGQPATLTVSNLPGRQFSGTVARSANALDPASRTLLIEVHVPNPDYALLPGMYAEVELTGARAEPPLLIPGDAMVVRDNGAEAAVVGPGDVLHLQKIQIGRDYGDHVEVLAGLRQGDLIVANPAEVARDGLKVEVVLPPGANK
jgi:RND family efflux transporter MFP subunit